MKRCAVVLIVCLTAGLAGAQEAREARWEIDAGAGASIALTSAYITVSGSASFKPRVMGIGIAAKALAGLSYADMYLAAWGRVDIGWLYLGGGVALPVKPPREDTGLTLTTPVVGPYLALGLAHGFIPMGPGKLGLDLGAEAFFSVVGVEPGEDVGSAIGSGIAAVLLSLFGAVKVTASVIYEVRL